ncbi:MAG TPA: hypothetical protein ACFYD6_00985 [Candidatus Brocadiia bacterium]|nr:hypothetical protein [Candidatus Brocadiales bacterium]
MEKNPNKKYTLNELEESYKNLVTHLEPFCCKLFILVCFCEKYAKDREIPPDEGDTPTEEHTCFYPPYFNAGIFISTLREISEVSAGNLFLSDVDFMDMLILPEYLESNFLSISLIPGVEPDKEVLTRRRRVIDKFFEWHIENGVKPFLYNNEPLDSVYALERLWQKEQITPVKANLFKEVAKSFEYFFSDPAVCHYATPKNPNSFKFPDFKLENLKRKDEEYITYLSAFPSINKVESIIKNLEKEELRQAEKGAEPGKEGIGNKTVKIENISNSNIVIQLADKAKQEATIGKDGYEELKEVLQSLKESVDKLGLEFQKKTELQEQIKEIDREMSSSKPNDKFITKCLGFIKGILVEVPSHMIAIQLVARIKDLETLF